MATKKPRYMSNVAIEGVDADGNRFTDREVSDKPFEGQGSEYFSAGASEAEAGRGKKGGPTAEELMSAEKPKRSAGVQQAIEEMQDRKMRKKISDMGFSSGGKVSSASKRADGIATKGKTRGKIC